VGDQAVTRTEAAEIRAAQLVGKAVREDRLRRALSILSRKPRRRWDLPTIPASERAYLNSILLFNLGRAIGRGD
jgi:hypothetical protein